MNDLVVLIPVLARPHRVEPLLASIADTTPGARVLFLTDPDDHQERSAIQVHGEDSPLEVDEISCGGTYAVKINHGVRQTGEPLLFLGADDLTFHPGWFDAALAHIRAGAQIVGVNDLCSRRVQRGAHATHFLVTRGYAQRPTIDGRRGPLCESYTHSFVDDELVATARRRGAIAFATDAVVEHHHPDNGTAEWDDTYRKGRENFNRDRLRFRQRRRLWL